MLFVGTAHAQGNQGNRQFIPPPPGPPPPAPPPDFIDDDTDFDDGDDLPDEYPKAQQQPGAPGQQQPGNDRAPKVMAAAPRETPHFNADGKVHFKVVEGQYYEPGKPRQRGKLEGQ
jgi:hypothetical protein